MNLFVRSFLLYFSLLQFSVRGQLTINVRNQGGDVLQETLIANVSEDSVRLEFQRAEGTVVTQFLDFQKEVHIYRLLILAEEEQMLYTPSIQAYQTVCFVARLLKQDFIAADAIAKLRQKNPNTVRTAEEDAGRDNSTFDYLVDPTKAHAISSHISPLCGSGSIYAREADLKFWAALSTQAQALQVLDAVQHVPMTNPQPGRCKEAPISQEEHCLCKIDFCIPWFPCGLKFCRGHDASGKVLSYRCGIKTCRKCLTFFYPASQKLDCPWDG